MSPAEDDDDDETAATTPGPGVRVRVTALVLSLLGLADSTYLTVTHFEKQVLVCPANSFINCAKVTTSAQSEILHIPVAVLGLVFYIAMTAINLPPLWKTTDLRVAWLRLAMAVSGIGFVLYLLYAELFIIKAICEYCTGVHIVTFALFILIVTTFPSMLARGTTRWDEDAGRDENADWDEEPAPSTP
ncbi:MAG TPA: vitamin K epoxide reductase family protein [Acidimicrobiales bacterium]|nr:vitamin K epoxide reductase family protein [Acidimicrobiales bacterium]